MAIIFSDIDFKKKKNLIFIVCAFVAYFITTTFSIRTWPFTDYPMFSESVREFDSIKSIAVYSISNGKEVRWSRNVFKNAYSWDFSLRQFFLQKDNPDLEQYLREKHRPVFGNDPNTFIEVRKVEVAPFREKLQVKETLIKRIPLNE